MRILVAYTSFATFVARDVKILREAHQVTLRNIYHRNVFRLLADLGSVMKADAVFLWFASGHGLPLVLTASLLGKRVVTVVGGYEAANLSEINYGSARSPFRRFLVRSILRLSERVLAVSGSTQREIATNLGIDPVRVDLLYHGFEDICSDQSAPRQQLVVNVGHVNASTWVTKGIFDLVSAAERMSDVSFLQIGRASIDVEKSFGRKLPGNLRFVGEVEYGRLSDYLRQAKVYLQLSRHESFGCSVAEAMLCECIPVVTDAYALPEVVGDCGVIVKSGDPEEIVRAVRSALAMPESEGLRCRRRILEQFSYEKRRDGLLQIFQDLARG